MNKKVLVSLVFAAVIFLTGLGIIIVNNIVNAFHPVNMNLTAEQRTSVSGNGGNAVIVGDYVYFTGNYVSTADIKYKQNEYNKVKFGAIYRVKLTAEGVPAYSDSSETHNTQLPEYKYHHIKDKQLIVPKVAGFENSALYIFDKYLIYTSPNNTKDKYGALQSDKLDFFRVNLDGSDHRHIYTTSSSSVTTADFTVACYGSSTKNIYILIKDGNNLRRINVTGSVGKVETISKKATSWALPVVSAYSGDGSSSLSASYGGVMNYVYYTEDLSDEEKDDIGLTGNVLKQYLVSKNQSSVMGKEHTIEFKVHSLSSGKLLYSVNNVDDSALGLNAPLYMTKGNTDANNKAPFTAATRDNYKILSQTGENGVIIQSEEVLQMPTENSVNSNRVFISLYQTQDAQSSSICVYKTETGSNRVSEKLINDVDSIITVTASTIYFRSSSNGEVMTADLFDNQGATKTGFQTNSLTRLTYFSKSGMGDRLFYITLFEDEASTNCAMMIDLSRGKEFILGDLKDEYLPENLKEKE